MWLNELPRAARAAWTDLRDRVRSVLGEELVAMWAHGGTLSTADPAHPGDLDTYVVIARSPDAETAHRLEEIHRSTAEAHGVEWDAWYVVADEARGTDPPAHAWREDRRDTSWAIHRAHWFAGRYVTFHGPDPGQIVPRPTREEVMGGLWRELEHIERHVVEGDTDPYEATYAFLNGSRILRALDTRDVVSSKHSAGVWALEHLPARWHDSLRAALRTYVGEGSASDAELLAGEMAPFVAFVREHTPPITDRPPDAAPRWSGY